MVCWLRRVLFCAHDDETLKGTRTRRFPDRYYPNQPVIIFHCKKCGSVRWMWG
jgi:hypothetical protein